jgi:hypothetical protein
MTTLQGATEEGRGSYNIEGEGGVKTHKGRQITLPVRFKN